VNVSALGFHRIVVQNGLSVNSKLFRFAGDSCHQAFAAECFIFLRFRSTFGPDAVLFRSLVLCTENLEGPAVTQPSPLVNWSGWSRVVAGKSKNEYRKAFAGSGRPL
jgi:hypothetical protein